jgi:hypothetical protein
MVAKHLQAVCLGLLMSAAAAAQNLPPETVNLSRIRQKAVENLSHLPDYTCLEDIQRSWRAFGARRLVLLDRLRYEVAHVGGRELYSWPGAGKLGEAGLDVMVGTGVIGTGAFRMRTRSVLLSKGSVFHYAGEETLDGRRALRYDYQIPLLTTTHTITNGGRTARVAYHGSFWVDAATFQVMRLTAESDNIPPPLGVSSAFTQVDYEETPIAGRSFLLPRRAEQRMGFPGIGESRNVTQFTDCRKYSATSVISFEPPPEETQAGKPAVFVENELPAGLLLPIQLETPIDSDSSAVGDPIQARLETDVVHEGETVAPGGALVLGRVRRLERLRDNTGIFLVGLEFRELEYAGHRVRFQAELKSTDQRRGLTQKLEKWELDGRPYSASIQELPGVGSFYMTGARVQLPRGFRMLWRTQSTAARAVSR